jgi:hypothetical protein
MSIKFQAFGQNFIVSPDFREKGRVVLPSGVILEVDGWSDAVPPCYLSRGRRANARDIPQPR